MRMTRILALAVLVAGLTLFAGCTGGGAKVQQRVTTVSQGKELEDLKKALDQGAITQSEYEKLQKKISKRGY